MSKTRFLRFRYRHCCWQILVLLLLQFVGSNWAHAWMRPVYGDPELVERAELIVLAHVKEGSIAYVPHEGKSRVLDWEHHATLIVTKVLKGEFRDQEIPIIIHYGLDPIISNGGGDSRDHPFRERNFEKYLRPASSISIVDFGGRHGVVSGDIRKDQIWLLRQQYEKGVKYQGNDSTGALGIWDPQDIQTLDFEPYFMALLSDQPEEKVKGFALGDSPLARRARISLDYLKIEEAMKEPDLAKRAALLLPLFLFTDQGHIGTRMEALRKLAQDCGEFGPAALVPIFQDPKYAAMQNDTMVVWASARYHGAVPVLTDFLRTENGHWTRLMSGEGNLTPNEQFNRSFTSEMATSKNRTAAALNVFEAIADPETKPIVRETRQVWANLFPSDRTKNLNTECENVLGAIQRAENEK